MASSPLGIIAEMLFTIVQSSIQTAGDIGGLFVKFLGAVGVVASSGTTGFLVAVGILSVVALFVWKFMFKSAKDIIIFFLAGAAILAVLFLAM